MVKAMNRDISAGLDTKVLASVINWGTGLSYDSEK